MKNALSFGSAFSILYTRVTLHHDVHDAGTTMLFPKLIKRDR